MCKAPKIVKQVWMCWHWVTRRQKQTGRDWILVDVKGNSFVDRANVYRQNSR